MMAKTDGVTMLACVFPATPDAADIDLLDRDDVRISGFQLLYDCIKLVTSLYIPLRQP